MYSKKIMYYSSLIDRSYIEVIGILLKKYGNVSDDFFREKSYNRFLNNEIKSIAYGKYKRTKEGLYTHHIDEYIYENLSNRYYIKENRYPFKFQKKERLVYADLIEHLILHALIAKETDGCLGYDGYSAFIEPMVLDWYTTDMIPKPDWMKAVYKRSFLTAEETKYLIDKINDNLLYKINEANKKFILQLKVKSISENELRDYWKASTKIDEYDQLIDKAVDFIYVHKFEDNESIENVIKKIFSQYFFTDEEINRIKLKEEEQNRIIREENQKIQEQIWAEQFPGMAKRGIKNNVSREKILKLMFKNEKQEKRISFKEFKSSKINTVRDDLLYELEEICKGG